MNNNLILILFPIFFMIHEFEEIIMIEKWIEKNSYDLHRRFPKASSFLAKTTGIGTQGFTIIVAEEFLIVSIITIASALTNNVIYWYCGLAAFSLHFIIHLLQFIIWRKYIPAIITTIICIPYCTFAIYKTSCMLTLEELIMYAVTGSSICGANLLIMHKLIFRTRKPGNQPRC